MDQPANTRRIFLPVQWLISPRSDVTWLLGSVLVAYAMFFAYVNEVLSITQVILIWVFAFHGPHFWGTLSRTYADRKQFRERRRLLTRSLWWYAAGPAIVGVGLLVQHSTPSSANPEGRNDIIRLFFFLAAVWAFHHVAKQHFGFLALYRAKHREFNKRDFLFHKHYLLISLWMPAIVMMTNNWTWLKDIPGAYLYATSYEGGVQTLAASQWYFSTICTWIFWLAQGAYGASLIIRLAKGQGINLPLLLLILCCVPLTYTVIMTSVNLQLPGAHFVLVPILTTYHNLQFHGLIWHYNRQKYRLDNAATAAETEVARADKKQRLGLAVSVNKNLPVYFFWGLVYTTVTIGIEHYNVPYITGAGWLPVMSQAFFWGFAFHHYYLDSKIWKASEDAELRQILGFTKPKPPIAQTPQPAIAVPGAVEGTRA